MSTMKLAHEDAVLATQSIKTLKPAGGSEALQVATPNGSGGVKIKAKAAPGATMSKDLIVTRRTSTILRQDHT